MIETNDASGNQGKQWKIRIFVIGFIIIVAAIGIAALKYSFGNSSSENDMPVFEVKQGPLTIGVTESGTIQARDQEILESEVEGQTTIIFLVPEGTQVKTGQLLIELDASQLVDEKVDQEIRVQNAEAAFIRARENLEVVKNQTQSDMDKAELDFDFAKQDLNKYIEGEYPKDLKEAQSKISLASEELQRAGEKLKWSKILFDELYLSQTELQADALAANKAKLDLELAITNQELLKDFTYKRDLASLESDVKQTNMALERVQRKANADIVQAEADLRAKESEFKRQQDKLKKIVEQISKTKIYTPKDGMVIYASSAQANWRGNSEPLEEGQQVRERQELIYLPTTASFKAEVKVHESSLDKISLGLPVRITVDALPGKVFSGEVAKIAPLPDAQSIFMNPDLKVYRTEINIQGEPKELRTGMSCEAEIIVTRYAETFYVPIQAVLKVGGTPSVYIVNGNKIERRPIEIGFDNNRMVRVVSGLETGEKVLLTPPLASATLDKGERDVEESVGTTNFGETAASNTIREQGAEPDSSGFPRSASAEQRSRLNRRRMSDNPGGVQGTGPGSPEAAGPGQSIQGEGRTRRGNLSPEQREEMRKRFENMSPEEREAMRQRWQRTREQNQNPDDQASGS